MPEPIGGEYRQSEYKQLVALLTDVPREARYALRRACLLGGLETVLLAVWSADDVVEARIRAGQDPQAGTEPLL
jgi:hypothetical protein